MGIAEETGERALRRRANQRFVPPPVVMRMAVRTRRNRTGRSRHCKSRRPHQQLPATQRAFSSNDRLATLSSIFSSIFHALFSSIFHALFHGVPPAVREVLLSPSAH